jgi:hypothetical protein
MHLDDERIERLRHGELTESAASAAREHLAGCGDCRVRAVETAREQDEVVALLRAVDHPVPALTAEAVASLARRHDERRPAGGPLRRAVRPVRWAAAILLVLGAAGVALARPASPMRAWLESAVAWLRDTTPARPVPRQAAAPESAGISAPAGRALVLVFSAPPGSLARVSLVDGGEVVIRAPAGAATFTSESERLLVEDRGAPDTFAVEIPRDARRVEIRAGARRLLVVEHGRVSAAGTAVVPGPNAKGVYAVPLGMGPASP